MGKINWRNVAIGGLVAGLIIDVVEGILEGVILGPEWRQAMQALGHPLRETGTNVTVHVLLGFAYGLTAVWLYAAIRPRFGAGPKTALYAGLGVWVLGSLLPSANGVRADCFPATSLPSRSWWDSSRSWRPRRREPGCTKSRE